MPENTPFEFQLNQDVELVATDERGYIIARAEFAEASNSYLVRYQAGDGRQVEQWWSESAVCAR